jgi:hypothetical protein
MDISIIILSWNDRHHLQECLESLRQRGNSLLTEIIVVDNASTDGSPEMVQDRFAEVKLIRNVENLGFPKGNNLGIRASRGKFVCLLNSDIKVLKGCINVLAEYMELHPDIGIIGPKIRNGDMTHQSSCRRFPSLWNNLCSATGLANVFRSSKFFSGEHMLYFKGDRLIDVEVLVGCFWLARREAIDEFGLLDEDFFMYAEDVDWCKRCWKAGWRVVFHPGAEAIHYRGASSTKRNPAWVEITQQRSRLNYWKKHHGAAVVMAAGFIMVVHRVIRCLGALLGHLVKPSKRGENRTRAQVNWACLKDILSTAERRTFTDS